MEELQQLAHEQESGAPTACQTSKESLKVRSFLYAAERSRCYRISLDGEPPNLINPDRKLCSAGTADPTSCCMRPLSSDEDDEDPLFYPMDMETEARIIKSFSGSSSDDGAVTGSGTQKRVPQDLANIPEVESGNLPMDLPEPSADDLSNLPDLDPNTSEPVEKRNANLTEYLPDLQQNPSEPVEKYPVEAELENSPCAETEKNIDHIGTQNQKSRLEQTTDSELTLPDATIPETEGDEQLVNTEQKCLEPSDSFPQEQIEKGKVRTTLPGSVDLAYSPQEASQSAMSVSCAGSLLRPVCFECGSVRSETLKPQCECAAAANLQICNLPVGSQTDQIWSQSTGFQWDIRYTDMDVSSDFEPLDNKKEKNPFSSRTTVELDVINKSSFTHAEMKRSLTGMEESRERLRALTWK
ncbi:uncharacterized protein V6R79_004939 [Siganus canaliculatus]